MTSAEYALGMYIKLVRQNKFNAGASEMDFEELLDRACDSANRPEMARLLLPSTLSEDTKRDVLKLSPEEFGRILAAAIDQINHGSVETVDALVKKSLLGE